MQQTDPEAMARLLERLEHMEDATSEISGLGKVEESSDETAHSQAQDGSADGKEQENLGDADPDQKAEMVSIKT